MSTEDTPEPPAPLTDILTVRTAKRLVRNEYPMDGEPGYNEVPIVELIVLGVIYTTDCTSLEHAMRVADQTVRAFVALRQADKVEMRNDCNKPIEPGRQ